jgi:hypothetical protein
MSKTVIDGLNIARAFIVDELETRESSYLPEPNTEEEQYVTSAQDALAAVDAALAAAKEALS